MRDTDIIALYVARDEQALRETEVAYGRFCMAIAMGILANASDAEECVNDTYLRAWQSIPPQNPPSLRTYLARITRNLAISRYRRSHRQKRNAALEVSLSELEECIPVPEDRSYELRECLSRFLEGLDALDRRLFVGRYWHNYPPRALAKANGMSTNAVNLRIMRVRERLREFLEKEGYTV